MCRTSLPDGVSSRNVKSSQWTRDVRESNTSRGRSGPGSDNGSGRRPASISSTSARRSPSVTELAIGALRPLPIRRQRSYGQGYDKCRIAGVPAVAHAAEEEWLSEWVEEDQAMRVIGRLAMFVGSVTMAAAG